MELSTAEPRMAEQIKPIFSNGPWPTLFGSASLSVAWSTGFDAAGSGADLDDSARQRYHDALR
jgi:hypothetical protein